ncbi:MAG: LysM peptidoglycan-binding domain-containing protein [Desulfobacterales bacterium]
MRRQSNCNALFMAGIIGLLALVLSGWASADTGRGTPANGYYYTVQKGDTLWDLSRRFADSPWVWPQLWTENADAIANPHLIYPGQKIRLTRKKGAPAAASKWEDKPLSTHVSYHYSLINQAGFVRKEPVAPLAVIFDRRDPSRTLLAQGDIVYIKPEPGVSLRPGEQLTVYRTFEPIYDKTTREYIGVQHLLLGVLKVIEIGPNYAVGELARSYRPVKISDKLMPFSPRSTNIRLEPSPAGIEGEIFEVEEPVTRFAEFHTAFINRGKAHGIRDGQLFSAFRRDETAGSRQPADRISIPVDFGELLVLHVEENTATVLMTDSDKELLTGTRIRTPLQAR